MSKKKLLPSRKYLNECFSYNKDTGLLFWKNRPREHFNADNSHKKFNNVMAGNVAGHVWVGSHNTYWVVKISGARYYCHRIIWKLVNDEEPNEIDHKNINSLDNSFLNLRNITPAQNRLNLKARKDNKSGTKGVYKSGNKWCVQIRRHGKLKNFGSYESIEEAVMVSDCEYEKLKNIEFKFS